MKKLLILFALFVSLGCFGQSVTGMAALGQTSSPSGAYMIFAPFSYSRIRSTDTVQLQALAMTNQQVSGITWSQDAVGGPTVTLPAGTLQTSPGVNAISLVPLSNLSPGPYRFTATVTLSTGQTFQTKDSLYVIAAPVPRTVTSLQVYVFGTWLPVPVSTATVKIGFSDGLTQ